jgi:hypothetical protein
MIFAKTDHDLKGLRASVHFVGRLSDSLVRLGPLSLGIDGVLSWIPGLGEIYSVVAAVFILVQGLRAGVAWPVLALCAALMFGRAALDAVPFAGPLVADIFTAHKWSARLITDAIDRKLAQPSPRPVRSFGWSGRRPAPTTGV